MDPAHAAFIEATAGTYLNVIRATTKVATDMALVEMERIKEEEERIVEAERKEEGIRIKEDKLRVKEEEVRMQEEELRIKEEERNRGEERARLCIQALRRKPQRAKHLGKPTSQSSMYCTRPQPQKSLGESAVRTLCSHYRLKSSGLPNRCY